MVSGADRKVHEVAKPRNLGGLTMHNSSAIITRATSLDRVQPKSRSTADRRSDSRVVRHALGRLRSVQLAGVIAPSARIDAPFICG